MQGPFTISEPDASQREFLFFLVDETDLSTPETGEAGGQPQIRKPGQSTWTNTSAVLVHVGNGHYMITLTAVELNIIGEFSIRYKSANTAEFQDTGRIIATSAEISLDEVNHKVDQNRRLLKEMEFKLTRVDKRTQPNPFVSPL
jgi:hypothetical protein